MAAIEPYRLKLSIIGNYQNPRFNAIVSSNSLIRGENVRLTFDIVNADSRQYPGGNITKLMFTYYGSSFGQMSFAMNVMGKVTAAIPPIPVGNKHVISFDALAPIEGVVYCEMALTNNENAQVNFEGSQLPNLIGVPFQVVSRELAMLVLNIKP